MKRRVARWALCVALFIPGALWIAFGVGTAEYPYATAEHFLRHQGLDVTRTQDLRALSRHPAPSLSLMLLGERQRMSPEQAQALLAWVYAGGRLLVTVQGFWTPGSSQDPLLDPLGIHALNAYVSAGAAPIAARSTLTELYLEVQDAPLLLGFGPGRHLEDSDDLAQSWANSPQGTHMVQVNMGNGTLTVVSDTNLWRNGAIGQFDNAWLLWYLNQGRQVVMQYRAPDHAPLPASDHRLPIGLYGAIVLLLMAWFMATRWPAPNPARRPGLRRGGSHLRASHRASLLKGLREDIQRAANRRHPGFSQRPVAEQWNLLARHAGIPTATVAKALLPPAEPRISASAFRRQVAQLQAIRNAL